MEFTEPTEAQAAFLRRLIDAAEPELASVIEAQFHNATVNTDQCPNCLTLRSAEENLPQLFGFGHPVDFAARDKEAEIPETMIYLWCSKGIVDWIEISWHGDEHPKLENLEIFSRQDL